ncbi:hypothetical protein ElyMa_000044000, partial [Elysia marginata]
MGLIQGGLSGSHQVKTSGYLLRCPVINQEENDPRRLHKVYWKDREIEPSPVQAEIADCCIDIIFYLDLPNRLSRMGTLDSSWPHSAA